jgi:8-oxo-dGTP pyrophosphatase MutT (NUDIX family)
MAETTDSKPPSSDPKILRPRDAATLIVVDRSGAEPRVLMGRRRDDLVFMAGKYVFPGGRVDPSDKTVPVASTLRSDETAKLLVAMRGQPSPARAQALAVAAVREAFEEAGLVIGAKMQQQEELPAEWRPFFELGFAPALAGLTFFARAITPPGRPRRFDSRFFCVDASEISERRPIVDGELSALEWVTMEMAKALDLPRITRVVLEDLEEQINSDRLGRGAAAVPFYYQRNGSFKRELIALS